MYKYVRLYHHSKYAVMYILIGFHWGYKKKNEKRPARRRQGKGHNVKWIVSGTREENKNREKKKRIKKEKPAQSAFLRMVEHITPVIESRVFPCCCYSFRQRWECARPSHPSTAVILSSAIILSLTSSYTTLPFLCLVLGC